jgi:toluene monooxygenase system protein E
MAQQKTYWHLMKERRMPSEYEIVTSKLLCYTGEGFTGKRFELDVPLQRWYKDYQEDSGLTCSNWEAFYDPRETTYTKYTDLQMRKEIFVDSLLEEIEATGYDRGLPAPWLPIFSLLVAPFRYPGHGLQMIAAYIGQMAPSGRLTIAAALQMADEVRRVERIAQRICQMQRVYPGFAEDGQARWQNEPLWQPLREAIEKLLITYDWGESFTALNLVLKPMLDEMFMTHVSDLALREGDRLLGQVFYSLNEDCHWHRQWSQALVRVAIADTPANLGVIQGWIDKWYGLGLRSIHALSLAFEGKLEEAKIPPFENVVQKIETYCGEYLNGMGLHRPLT